MFRTLLPLLVVFQKLLWFCGFLFDLSGLVVIVRILWFSVAVHFILDLTQIPIDILSLKLFSTIMFKQITITSII